MRILAVVGDFPAVSKTFVTDQLVGLMEAGHRVRILADPPAAGQSPSAMTIPQSVRDAIVYRAPSPPDRLGSRDRGLLAAGRVRGRAPRVLRLARMRRLGMRRRVTPSVTLLNLIEAEDPDIVHCHFAVFGVEVVEAARRLGFSGRVAAAFHGWDVSSHIERFGRHVYDDLFEAGHLLLPVSERWRDRLVELGASADKVRVQRMGVDLAAFAPVERPDMSGRHLRLLSVGRLIEKKGFSSGLQAAARLQERGVGLRYTIVGEGTERQALQHTADRLGLREQVEFLGAQSREQVATLLGTNDVLLCPSHTARNGDAEGIPIALMEAMATAMPVVSTWHSGIPELIEDERSGLLAPERDPDALADRIERIAKDRSLALELGRNARQRIEAAFDLRHVVRQLEARFQDLVGTSRS